MKYQFLKGLFNVHKFLGFQTVLILDLYEIPFHAVLVFFHKPRPQQNVLCVQFLTIILKPALGLELDD